MSYVSVPPAYYRAQQPGTPFHAGSRGWEQAPVPGWGENPNSAWPARQGVNGFGAAAAPPAAPPPAVPRFSYVGTVPQQNYIRVGIAPWGSFPNGPAYDFPRESNCPTCVGWPNTMSIGSIVQASRDFDRGDIAAAVRAVQGLGEGCGPCQISAGGSCQVCPNGSDLPECSGCVDGQAEAVKRGILEHPLAGPVIVAMATAVAAGVATYFAKRAKIPVG